MQKKLLNGGEDYETESQVSEVEIGFAEAPDVDKDHCLDKAMSEENNKQYNMEDFLKQIRVKEILPNEP